METPSILYNSAGVLKAKVFFGASPAGPIVLDLRQRGRPEQCRHLTAERRRRSTARSWRRTTQARSAPRERSRLTSSSPRSRPGAAAIAPYAADWFEVTNTGTGPLGHHRLEDGRQLECLRPRPSRCAASRRFPQGSRLSSSRVLPTDPPTRRFAPTSRPRGPEREFAQRLPHRVLRRRRRRPEHRRVTP